MSIIFMGNGIDCLQKVDITPPKITNLHSMFIHQKCLNVRRHTVKSIYILILLMTSVYLSKGQSITLDEILQEARNNAFPITAAKNNLDIADAQLKFYKAELKPSIGLDLLLPNFLNTSTQVTQPDGSIAFQQITQNNSSISLFGNQNITATGGQVFAQTDLQRFDNFTSDTKQYNGVPIRVGFIQPLFAVNRFKWDKKIIPLAQEEANLAYNIAIQDAQWRATSLYFDVLLAQANRDIAQTNKGVNEKLIEITKERLELGKTSRDEFLQLKMSLKNAILSENQANNEVAQSLRNLYTFLGKKEVSTTLNCLLPEQTKTAVLDIDNLVARANNNRPELKRYEREILEGDQELARTKSQYGINANLFASFGFARGSTDIDQIYRNPFDEQQVRLNVSMPIVDWGRKKQAVKIANINKANIQQRTVQESLELENRVKTIAAQFLQAQSDISLLDEIKEVAEERFNISNERYTLGNISITDLTLAQREKDQTYRQYIQALNNYWSTYWELRTLIGGEI
jgi:outer membrane protein